MKKILSLFVFLFSIISLNTSATEIVTNGSFSATTGWTVGGTFYYNSIFDSCRVCPGYAYASNSDGSPGINMNAFLEQNLTIPSSTLTANLSFWCSSKLTGSSTGQEKLFVYLYDYNTASTYPITTILFSGTTGYTFYSFSVPSSLFGHSLKLGFNARSSTTATTVRLDEVSICAAEAPTGLSATAISPNSIQLNWPAIAGSTSYSIYYSNSSCLGDLTLRGTSTSNSFVATTLSPGNTYYFNITATGPATCGTSFYSNCANATTPTTASSTPVNLIVDGDFSTTNPAWHPSGNFQYDSRFPTAHSPTAYAYLSDFLGFPANNITGRLYQDFFVPSGTEGVNVSFWYRITTDETTTGTVFDTCRVSLINLSSGNSTLVSRLTNLNKNAAYAKISFNIPALSTGVSYRLQFDGGTDYSLPTVFRIDDVAAMTTVSSSSCISWVGAPPSTLVNTAMNKLCSNDGIISSIQDASTLSSNISRLEIARCLGKALFRNEDMSFLDNFPTVIPALGSPSLSLADKRYLKLMLYLEHPSQLSPGLGTDDISPFSRDYFYTTFSTPVKKSDAIKAMLETWNIPLSLLDYNPGSSANSSTICDMPVSDKNVDWVRTANVLGLLSGITTSCGAGINLNDGNITYADFYVMLARLIDINPPTIGYDAFFIPNVFYLTNTGATNNLSKGVFNEYSDNGFNIPSGGLGLQFQYSYHSNLTEIPFLDNDTDIENNYLKPKLQPLGGGWTHSYSAYIKTIGAFGTSPQRILIYWPDGTINSFRVDLNSYETKGLTDKLTVDSTNSDSQPSKVTIRRGRIVYTFRNIDLAYYNVLSLSSIADAYGNLVNLEYANGYAPNPSYAPKVLTKVTDMFSGRYLTFSYTSGTNYLRAVTDPISRTINFYVNRYNHDLDSVADAKTQYTKYSYFSFVGSIAYRCHLLNQIRRPKGNNITNTYAHRKIRQSQASNYLINVTPNLNYQSPYLPQNYQVSVSRNGADTVRTNYFFDFLGNSIGTTTSGKTASYVVDTATNRVLVARDVELGFVKRYSYDANGFVNKVVTVDSIFSDSIKNEYINNSFGEVVNEKDYNDPTTYYTETKYYRNSQGSPTSIVTNEGLGGEVRHNFGYSTNGLLTSYTSPGHLQTDYSYNSYGNVGTIIHYPLSGGLPLIENINYDGVSRVVERKDKLGIRTTYNYDQNDNLTDEIKDPDTLNLITHYTFDANDNPLTITSPKGHMTTLAYDFNTDDLIEENDGTNKKKWRYNQDGSLDSFITKNSFAFKYSYYDAAPSADSALAGLLRSDGNTVYQYWANSRNPYHINNSSGKVNWFWYDTPHRSKWNKPALVGTENFLTVSDNVAYDYDRMMRPSLIGYPAMGSTHYVFNYNYDFTTKKLATVTDAGTPYGTYATYSYLNDGRPSSTTYGNGDIINYHYDNFGRLDSIWATNQSGVLLYTDGATLDKNGRRIRENPLVYYGGVADTTSPPLVNGTASYSYETRNRITSGDGKTFTNSNAGEITGFTLPNTSCTWSNYGELTNITRGSSSVDYDYDPLHFRRKKGSTYYVVDQQNTGNPIMECTQSGSPISAYVWGNGLVCRIDPGTNAAFYYHYDIRGSVIAITNQNGDLVKFYKYDDYGKVYKTGGSITWQNPYQYIGREGVQADDTDLYYMKARYYQPSTGRFIKEDPKWNTNLFTYADDDPINNIDPGGEMSENNLNTVDKTNTAVDINLTLNEAGLAYARSIGGLGASGSRFLTGVKFLGKASGILGIAISGYAFYKDPSLGNLARLSVSAGALLIKDNPIGFVASVALSVADITGASDSLYNGLNNISNSNFKYKGRRYPTRSR